MKEIIIPKEEIKYLYEINKLSTFEIAKKFKCCQATVWKKLHKFKIKPRLPGGKRVKLSKTDLHNLYIKKKLSTWKIEKELGIPRSTIHRKLKEYNIKTRDRAESHFIYKRKNFSGNLLEKSYLIGFKLGDLRARKQYKNSRTISLACSSTIPEQIELIKRLFEKYGRVWIKKSKNNIIHSEAHLNESFDFLLIKEVPLWVTKNKGTFFSFLAGFIDAEGCIKIHKKVAYFNLGNYDSGLLFIIHKKLNRFGIKCNKPHESDTSNYFNKEGYGHNKNYWQIRISKKDPLLELLKEIEPFIKHKNKVNDLNKAKENIILRNRLYGDIKL